MSDQKDISKRLKDRIDDDDQGRLDDIAIEDVELFRMERMTEQTFWIKIYKNTGNIDHVFHLEAVLDENGYPSILAYHETEGR